MSAYAAGISKKMSGSKAPDYDASTRGVRPFDPGIIKNITAYAEGTIKNALAYAEKSHGQFRFFRFNWYR